MIPFLLSQLPTLIAFGLLLKAVHKMRKQHLLFLAVAMYVSVEYSLLCMGSVVTCGHVPFPGAGLLTRLVAPCALPFILLCYVELTGQRMAKGKSWILFVPSLALFVITLLEEGGTTGYLVDLTKKFVPGLEFRYNDSSVVGWSLTELFLLLQGLLTLIRSWYDKQFLRDVDHRTDNINLAINGLGMMSFVFLVLTAVGINIWQEHKDYALWAFCMTGVLFYRMMDIMKMCAVDMMFVTGDDIEMPESAEHQQEIIMQEAMAEVAAPVLPEEAVATSVDEEEKEKSELDAIAVVSEPSRNDMLALHLKNLVEEEKIYLQAGIRIEDVALTLGTNRTYTARMMKETFGRTFAEQMNYMRLKSARRDMLQRKDASIETIALSNGFNSSNTFTKVFTQRYNCSPSAWRHEQLSSAD